MENKKVTTIKLKNDTKSLLDKLKIIERESYDEVIQRLVQPFSKKQSESNFKTPKAIPEKIKTIPAEKKIPEKTENAKEEKIKFLQNILGTRTDNKKEGALKKDKKEDKKEEKREAKVSSNFSYP